MEVGDISDQEFKMALEETQRPLGDRREAIQGVSREIEQTQKYFSTSQTRDPGLKTAVDEGQCASRLWAPPVAGRASGCREERNIACFLLPSLQCLACRGLGLRGDSAPSLSSERRRWSACWLHRFTE